MKRALVISLMVLGISLSAAAAGFTGTWSTNLGFTINQSDSLTVSAFTSLIEVDYTIGDWTFGANTFIDKTGLFDLNFDVGGVLGAFSYYSLLDFDPTAAAFESWENLISVSIAGVSFYAAFAVQDTVGDIGTGWAIGGHGVAGDVEISIEADFNLLGWGASGAYWAYYEGYGWDIMHDWGYYWSCAYGIWDGGFWAVQTDSCTSAFTNLDVIVEMPLACLDLLVWVNFDCTNGFDFIQFDLNDIDLGAGWFQLDDLNIKFTTQTKSVTTDFTVTFGDAVCITPYFDIVHGSAIITGIELDALMLSYNYNGVTVKAGELFPTAGNWYVGFTKSGSLTHYAGCAVTGANEFFGVWFDGDSCCGGLTAANFAVFFDADYGVAPSATGGIFDYVLAVANVEIGIGSSFSISTGLEVAPTGVSAIKLGFDFSF